MKKILKSEKDYKTFWDLFGLFEILEIQKKSEKFFFCKNSEKIRKIFSFKKISIESFWRVLLCSLRIMNKNRLENFFLNVFRFFLIVSKGKWFFLKKFFLEIFLKGSLDYELSHWVRSWYVFVFFSHERVYSHTDM